jgi:large subunit ribosomal protein L26e
VLITKLHMDKDRKALLARKGGAKGTDAADAMQTVS